MAADQSILIPRVKLGNQGFEVSKLGFGCMGLSGVYNDPVPEDVGISIIKHAFDHGVTFFDTSDIYGANNANEILVGKALKQLPREKVQLATKFGIIKFDFSSGAVINGTPKYVRSSCEASLKRLDVEYIDLYYQHRIDTSIPIEDTMGELKKLVEEGKIKYIGLSEASPDTIRRANAVHPITAIQMEWSLWTRDIEEEIVPLCRELGIGIVPYSPLGRGFFGGRSVVESIPATSFLASIPRFLGENFDKNKKLYWNVEKLAEKHECTPAQLALSWILHQGDDVVPIPGTTKIKNLDSNTGCFFFFERPKFIQRPKGRKRETKVIRRPPNSKQVLRQDNNKQNPHQKTTKEAYNKMKRLKTEQKLKDQEPSGQVPSDNDSCLCRPKTC